MTDHTQQHSTWLAAHHAHLTAEDLWLHYFSVGGYLGVFELDAYLHGLYALPQGERNTVALALNELIDDQIDTRLNDLSHHPKAEFVHGPVLD
ncbi:hypothetical protein [Arthrobacter pityocampae]|uniref:hypothetical protein n=1 Tax=Arthrobacter pityocampae TaxID=547334 RepID=UPI003736BF72